MASRQPVAGSVPAFSPHSQHAGTSQRELERSLLYSEELGIRWFLASLLFGARISETVAKNTYRAFMRHGLTTLAKIAAAGWDFLVSTIMREGGYVRYDGRKSTQVLRDCEALIWRQLAPVA